MIRLFPLALLALALEGCPSKQDIASASALPAYQLAAQAIINQNAAKPFTDAEKPAIKAADQKAFDAVVAINAEQMRLAAEKHRLIQAF